MRVAVVIPTLNEADNIAATLMPALAEADEVVVVDGGSVDATRELAAAAGVPVLTVTGGRAAQQNAGAAGTSAEALLFLHADTRLPVGWAAAVRGALAEPGVALGAFRLAIDGATASEWLMAAGANARSRSWGVPYGDQALFLRRATFDALGGFAVLPIMEDWEFARRARRLGHIYLLDLIVMTSPRRWRRLGPWRTWGRNQLMLIGWRLGLSPARLAAYYRGS